MPLYHTLSGRTCRTCQAAFAWFITRQVEELQAPPLPMAGHQSAPCGALSFDLKLLGGH